MGQSSGEAKRIRGIAARGTPLWERQPGTSDQGAKPDAIFARRRLNRWRAVLGSAKVLNRRLRSSEIPKAALEDLLGNAQREAELPSWASTIASILNLSSHSEAEDLDNITDRSFHPTQLLPFQEVLVGFVRHARQWLRAEAGAAIDVLCPSALVDFERQLLGHITFVASMTIGLDFYGFRFERAPASAIESVWCRQNRSTVIYSAYVQHMHCGGLVDLLDTHPVLARLLSQSVEQWVRATANFCLRFLDDFSNLRAQFDWRVKQPEGAVAHVRPDLSDRHHDGQTVTECVLRTDESVIYKPRTVGPEVAFYEFLGWLNSCNLSLDLKVLRVLDRTTHGWVESIPCAAVNSEAEVERFYIRAGMLLGALHALVTTDVHCENLIASGEQPVVVDLETLLSERAQDSQQSPEGQDPGGPSVLSTGFLPRWQTAPDGHRYDMSALGSDADQDAGIRLFAWRSINTDQMTLSEETSAPTSTTHRVRLAGALPSVADYLQEFLRGFREVYLCLLVNREDLISNDRLLSGFDHLELRILLRSSATYACLQLHLLHPEFLRDGLDRSIELEWLARPLGGTTTPQKGRIQVYDAERTAMEGLDIPHFGTLAWKTMRHTSDDPDLSLLCGERDSRVLERRLASLSAADCSRQIAIIKDAVRSRFGRRSLAKITHPAANPAA
jgi:type 2 lantibiotic biosynthesis protein LanM